MSLPLQFRSAYFSGLAQFVSAVADRPAQVATPGYSVDRRARAFAVRGPAREFKVSRPKRTYRITP